MCPRFNPGTGFNKREVGTSQARFELGGRLHFTLLGMGFHGVHCTKAKVDVCQNLYYRRTRRQDVNLVTDIQLLGDKEEPSSPGNWHKVTTSLRSGILRAPPLFLWYRTGETLAHMSAEERSNIITELDVLYGEDIPWYGFEKIEPATMAEKGRVEATWITYRRGVKRMCTFH